MILATGSRVKSLPGIVPDGKRIVTSDDILKSESMPASVIVIGAGAVGVEFASMYHDLGAEVTLLEYLPAIVPLEDREVSKELERSFTRRGLKVITNARFDADGVKADETGVSITVGPDGKDRAEVRAEILLVAAGRATNVEDVGLETTSAEVDRGIVKVDGHMRTARAAPVRDRRHRRRADARAHGRPRGDHRGPHDRGRPGRARDGLPQAAAGDVLPPADRLDRPDRAGVRGAGLPIKSAKVPFQAIAKALIGGEYEGFAKVIANKDTDETLGVHMIGPHATDLIAEASARAARSRRRRGRSGSRPTPTRRCRRSWARRRWRSTGGPSTAEPAGGAAHDPQWRTR